MKLKSVIHFICFISIVAFTTLFYYQLIDKEYRWTFQPGSDGSILEIKKFYAFMENPGRATFPGKLVTAQTYLTGPFIITAAAAHVVNFLVTHHLLPSHILSNSDSLFIFSFRYMNLLFYALSAGLAYLCLYRVFSHAIIGFLLTISIFVFNNVVLNISFSEVDIYLLFSCLLFFYTAFRLIENPQLKFNYVLFGIAFILSAATKINTPLFLHIPGILVLLWLIRRQADTKKLGALAVTIVALSLVFFIRWYVYPESIIPYLAGVIEEGKMWFTIAGNNEYFFYHNFLFYNFYLPYDFYLPISFFIIAVACLLPFIIIRQIKIRQPEFILLIAIFMVHSVGLIFGPKFYRYGFLMPFYYLMIIGFALSELQKMKKQKLFAGISASLIVLPFTYNIINYTWNVKAFNNGQLAFQTVKMKPRHWIYENIKPGTKIARTGRFGSPPINISKYDFSPRFLRMPWGNPERIITKIPPEKNEVSEMTDVILISNKAYYERPHIIEKLVEDKYDVIEDSIQFTQYAHSLETILPGITDKLCAETDTVFTEETFFTEILSPMWEDGYSLQQSLEQYLNQATHDKELTDTLIELTLNVLFDSDTAMLNYGYTELINTYGRMMYVYAWKQFFNDIDDAFKTVEFESSYEFKGVKWQKVIIVNETCLKAS